MAAEPELWLFADGRLHPLAQQPGATNLARAQNLATPLARAVLAYGPTEYAHVNPPHLLAAIADELAARAHQPLSSDRARAFATASDLRARRRWFGPVLTNYGGR